MNTSLLVIYRQSLHIQWRQDSYIYSWFGKQLNACVGTGQRQNQSMMAHHDGTFDKNS